MLIGLCIVCVLCIPRPGNLVDVEEAPGSTAGERLGCDALQRLHVSGRDDTVRWRENVEPSLEQIGRLRDDRPGNRAFDGRERLLQIVETEQPRLRDGKSCGNGSNERELRGLERETGCGPEGVAPLVRRYGVETIETAPTDDEEVHATGSG